MCETVWAMTDNLLVQCFEVYRACCSNQAEVTALVAAYLRQVCIVKMGWMDPQGPATDNLLCLKKRSEEEAIEFSLTLIIAAVRKHARQKEYHILQCKRFVYR